MRVLLGKIFPLLVDDDDDVAKYIVGAVVKLVAASYSAYMGFLGSCDNVR